jgi:pre-60S factor REI1
VASLPPISSEVFAEKVLATKADAAATAAKASFQKHCDACQRSYYSENAHKNHLGSQKHKANVLRLQAREAEAPSIMSSTFSLGQPPSSAGPADDAADEELTKIMDSIKTTNLADSDDTSTSGGESDTKRKSGAIPLEESLRACLFCNHVAADAEQNVAHMSKTHGLFIPERQYLTNLDGLIVYLSKKVKDDYQCLYCNRLKWSEEGIKTHMRDMGHCNIAYDTEDHQLEIGEFYDFRSTYSDAEDEDADMPELNHSTSGGDTGEDGWETSSEASSVPTEELGKLYCDKDREELAERLRHHRHHSHANPAKHHTADGWHSHAHAAPHAVYHDEFELHLPSGRIAGHRSLNRYFRQNLHKYPSAAERLEKLLIRDGSDEDEDDVDDARRGRHRGRAGEQQVTRANGGLGMVAVSESKKREVLAMEKRFRVRAERQASLKKWRAEKNANHQKHYRDPLLQ